MAKVLEFDGTTCLDIPAERVLQGAIDNKVCSAVVVGTTEDGDLYFASSIGPLGDTLLLLERAKDVLMEKSRGAPFKK